MATDRCLIRFAATATCLQLLFGGCQSASPEPASSGSQPAAVGGSGAAPATSSSSSAMVSSGTAGSTATTSNTPAATMGKAGSGATRPAADSGSPATATANTPSSAAAGSTASMSSMAQAGSSAQAGAPAMATAGAAAMPASAGGSLPALTDFKAAGPFTPKREAGPAGYVLFYPTELGRDGVKHPILSWGPGAAETAGDFSMLLNHLASHGFAVISFDGTPQGQELVTAIDWMLSENMRDGSAFYQKLDDTKISAGGHSAGSLATFVIGKDARLVTTLHISGGTFDPHTDIMNLHAPALFVCGEPGGDGLLMGDVAHPNCEIDFENATVPVFYGITKGASHMTPTDIGDPAIRAHQFAAMVGWLRWQLAGDQNAKTMFTGDACTLCMDSAWSTAKNKNLD